MRFEFAREREDPPIQILRVLDFPTLGELQGRNGVGKSLAVKMLVLLTGDQPWVREEEAWRTLRDRLSPMSVTAFGLDGAQTLEWDLTPSAWPEVPPQDISALFAPTERGTGVEARIDGKPAQLADIRRLVRVHRLVGEETLADSVNERVLQMESRAQQEAAIVSSKCADVRTVLKDAMELLEPLSGRTIRRLEDEHRRLLQQRAGYLAQQKQNRERAGRLMVLENRSRALNRLDELQGNAAADDISAKLATINKQINQVTADRDQRIDAAVADVQLRQRIHDARAEADRVEDLLERAVDDARRLAADAQLDSAVSEMSAELVAGALDKAMDDVKRLKDLQVSLDAVPLVRRAATAVKGTLDHIEPPSLLGHPFVILAGQKYSGRELSDGISAELRDLAGAVRDPSGEQLEQQLAAASSRVDTIGELRRALARQRRHTSALRNRRAALLELTGQASGEASERYTQLESQLAGLEDERRNLQGSQFRYSILLEDLGPGEDLDQARQRLSRDLNAAGVVVDHDLAETRAATEMTLRNIDFQLRETDVALDEGRRDLESARERRELGVQALEQSALVIALRHEGALLPDAADGDGIERFAEDLLRGAERVIGALDRLRRESEGVKGAFRWIESGQSDSQDMSRIDRVRGAAERQIVDALNQPVLQRELFDQGVVDGYDHLRKTVSFRPGNSVISVTRALNAFSSGQRVFAYTQMRLRGIADGSSTCANRLVALDEFGAFLEVRRIRALERMIQDELLGHGIDRVLFILPLAANQTVNEDGYVTLDRSVR